MRKATPTEIAPRISVDPRVKGGKPVITGTRVPVEHIIAELGGGMTIERVMAEYSLDRDDVLAALRYAAKTLAREEVRAFP